jgi:ABC-2 type transport system permease protein
MISIFKKELQSFFGSITGYLVIGIFLTLMGSFMWIFRDTSLLDYNYATLDQLFSMAPMVYLFLIPAITMRSFAEEKQKGTLEFLYTKPLPNYAIVMGKFLANFTLVILALLPTLLYYYSVYQLGSPKGNLDSGAIIGSYIGLFFLSGAFVAIGLFASSLTDNQIVAFILGAFLCFVVHWAFMFIATMSFWSPQISSFIDQLGFSAHYASISKGALDSRDIIYFLSVIIVFLIATQESIESDKN